MARSYEDAAREYKKLAWRLDKQMYRLEKAAGKEEYKNILKFAYAKMKHEISVIKPGATRWGQKLPGGKDDAEKLANLEKRIAVMKQYEKLPSFSLTKVKKIYKKAAETINKKYKEQLGGYKLTWQDITNYYGSYTAGVMDAQYGSDTNIIALGKFKKMSLADQAAAITKMKNNPNVLLDDDIAVSNALKTLLSNL